MSPILETVSEFATEPAWGKPALRLLCGGDDCASAPLAPVE